MGGDVVIALLFILAVVALYAGYTAGRLTATRSALHALAFRAGQECRALHQRIDQLEGGQ